MQQKQEVVHQMEKIQIEEKINQQSLEIFQESLTEEDENKESDLEKKEKRFQHYEIQIPFDYQEEGIQRGRKRTW